MQWIERLATRWLARRWLAMESPYESSVEVNIQATHESAMGRASRAKAIVDDDLFRESVAHVVASCHSTWARSRDDAERMWQWHRLQALNDVVMHLRDVISRGKIAADAIERERDRERRSEGGERWSPL